MSEFRSFWFGEAPSPYERLAMQSFVDFGHSYVLYAYEKYDVPRGVELRDASDILPRDRVFTYKDGPGRGSVSAFSNVFRYRLLQQLGGWWIDTDVICQSETIAEPDIFVGWEEEGKAGSAILRFPAGHPATTALYEAAEAAGENIRWGQVGPRLVTRVVMEHGLAGRVTSRKRGFPVPPANALDLLRPAARDAITELAGRVPLLHYWNEILRRAVVFKWMAPPAGSYFASLFQKHRVAPGAVAYASEEIERLNENFLALLNPPLRSENMALRKALAAERDKSAALSEALRLTGEERGRLSEGRTASREQRGTGKRAREAGETFEKRA